MVALNEAYKDNPLLSHQIIPLDFGTAGPDLPESHDWALSDAGFSSSGDRRLSPPVVDLADPEAPALMSRACEEWGAFLLTGHGIPAALTAEAEAETRRLFGLPADRKLLALRSPAGATGYGSARISPFFSKHMWHEGFTIMGSPEDHAKILWPVGSYERFCEVMDDYQKEMKKLTEKILGYLLKSLNISDEKILESLKSTGNNNPCCTGPSTALQLNSYPSCPDPNRAIGMAPHTDTFLLTVVHQTPTDGSGQLQLLKDEGPAKWVWVPVPHVPGALVVNVGDLFHILSDGRYRSVVHRVAVNRTSQRYSFAHFYGPPLDFTVSPVGATDRSPRYRSLTVREYVGIKAKSLDKALSLVRV